MANFDIQKCLVSVTVYSLRNEIKTKKVSNDKSKRYKVAK